MTMLLGWPVFTRLSLAAFGRSVTVWRIEYQFRRPALAALGLTGMREVVRHRQALWDHGCRWLSLRSRVGDSNLAR